MSPYQHGEVFVTDDGAETDLDLAITNASPGSRPKATTSPSGRIYQSVIAKGAAATIWARRCR
jgi:CTP synthase (UTP-ammonia lyase)